MKKKKIVKRSKPSIVWNKIILVGLFILSLFLVFGILQPTETTLEKPRANYQQAEPTTPPQCAAAKEGVCVPSTDGCLAGAEINQGKLDCATGEVCCGAAPVPAQCEAANGFCATTNDCTEGGGKNSGTMGCTSGTICCTEPPAAAAPTEPVPSPNCLGACPTSSPINTPVPTTPVGGAEPTDAIDPTAVNPEPTESMDPEPIVDPCASEEEQLRHKPGHHHPGKNNQGLLQMLVELFKVLFQLIQQLLGGAPAPQPEPEPTPEPPC